MSVYVRDEFCNQSTCAGDGECASSWHHLLLPIITPLFPLSNRMAAACACLVHGASLFFYSHCSIITVPETPSILDMAHIL